jgi:hypothetical protein
VFLVICYKKFHSKNSFYEKVKGMTKGPIVLGSFVIVDSFDNCDLTQYMYSPYNICRTSLEVVTYFHVCDSITFHFNNLKKHNNSLLHRFITQSKILKSWKLYYPIKTTIVPMNKSFEIFFLKIWLKLRN